MLPLHSIFGFLLSCALVVAQNSRIDTHFHALPPAYLAAVARAGGDPSGFPTPNWTLAAAVQSMDILNTSSGILSVSSPGVPIAGRGREARKLARTLNQNLGNYSMDILYAPRIGFFGTLPDWRDVDGTLAEIDYLYSHQKLCSGVVAYTTYGKKLLGDESFVPIWQKLQAYKALVFIHPSLLDITPKFIAGGIPQPVVDYPLATTRTAVDLVMTGRVRACPDVDIILSHAGGSLPFLGTRALGSLAIPAIAALATVKVNESEARIDFNRFYYDIALSTSPAQLDGLLDFSSPSRILFGSDFPYAPQGSINTVVAGYTSFSTTNPRGGMLQPSVLRSNAITLLKKHTTRSMF